ncbi:HAD family hydrolase [Haloglycomyces albus]|uniref:HAD family hydrolase n=1 Tax=Haloglycomyces albus TaxID=526067 RepID=UPI00046D5AD1|nr:HAD-IB family hydrolase [Haloglycomyces albus]
MATTTAEGFILTSISDSEPLCTKTAQASAFFDVDNTLMYGASMYWLGKGLVRHGIIPPRAIARFTWKQIRYRFFGSEHRGHMDAVKAATLELVAGTSVRRLKHICAEIVDRDITPRILNPVRRLAETHLNAGHEVWLVTAGPKELADIIAARLGFTGALGTIAEVSDGQYTGQLQGGILHAERKAVAVEELAASRHISLRASTAYSDSANDIPMLSAVGQPVAVNPDRKLGRHAHRNNWPTFNYRNRLFGSW